MSRADPNKSNFSGGEFDPLFQGRVDHQRYDTGLKLCKNWIPTLQGSVIRRPGAKSLGGWGVGGTPIPFNSVGGISYWLIRGTDPDVEQYSVYRGDRVISTFTLPGRPSSYVQINDTVFFASETTPLFSVSRVTETQWNVRSEPLVGYDVLFRGTGFVFGTSTNGVHFFSDFIDSTLTKNAANNVVVDNVPANFSAMFAGYRHSAFRGDARLYIPVGLISGGDNSFLSGYLSVETGTIVNSSGVPVDIGTDTPLGVVYNVYDVGDITNYRGFSVSSVGNSGIVLLDVSEDATVAERAYLAQAVALLERGGSLRDLFRGLTYRIGFGDPSLDVSNLNTGKLFRRAVSPNYFPKTVDFFESRLILSGSRLSPDQIDLSVTDDYTNFTIIEDDTNPQVLATSSISKNIASESDDTIVWTQNTKEGLYIGSYGGVWLMKPSNDGSVVTNRDSSIRRISRFGAAPGSNVLSVGESIIYIDRSGRTLREITATQDGYANSDLNLLARHMLEGGVDTLAVTYLPQQVIWCCGGGDLYGMTYQRSVDGISVGWHRHTILGGEDITQLESLETDTGYQLGMTTERGVFLTLNIEDTDLYFDVLYDVEVDGDFNVGTIGTVDLVSNGAIVEKDKVVSGMETFEAGTLVGKRYDSDLQFLRFDAGARAGTSIGKQRRAQRMGFLLYKSASFLFGRTFDKLKRVIFRDPDDVSNELTPLFSGIKTESQAGGYSYDEEYCLRADGIRACNILSVTPQMKTEERQ